MSELDLELGEIRDSLKAIADEMPRIRNILHAIALFQDGQQTAAWQHLKAVQGQAPSQR
jgi:hypothetical protein